MIKKYNDYVNESVLDHLKGVSDEELFNNLSKLTPEQMLYKSAEIGFLNGVIYALEQGVDINITERNQGVFSALRKAMDYNKWNIANYLIEHGADVNAGNGTLLFQPVLKNNYELVKTLIDKGINTNPEPQYFSGTKYTEHGRYSLLEIAVMCSDVEIIKLLIKSGTSVTANRNACIKHAIYVCDVPVLKLLISKGANKNVYNNIEKKFDKSVSYDDMIKTLQVLNKK